MPNFVLAGVSQNDTTGVYANTLSDYTGISRTSNLRLDNGKIALSQNTNHQYQEDFTTAVYGASSTALWDIANHRLSLKSKNIFVAKNGLDANSGTEDAPFLTVAKALAVVQPGDTIYVKKGIYYVSSYFTSIVGTADAPITIMPYPGDRYQVIFDGEGVSLYSFGYSSLRYLTIDGFIFRNYPDGPILGGPYTCDHNIYKNSIVYGILHTGEDINCSYNKIINNLYIGGQQQLYLPNATNNAAILNNSFLKYSRDTAIYAPTAGTADHAIKNNIFYTMGNYGVDDPGHYFISYQNGGISSIDNNLYYNPFSNSYLFHYNHGAGAVYYSNNSADFSTWQGYGFDAHSLINQDPMFTPGDLGLYYLAANSPAIDAGANDSDVSYLTDGNWCTSSTNTPDTGTVDMGFHYFCGTAEAVANRYPSSGEALSNEINSNDFSTKNVSKATLTATYDLNGLAASNLVFYLSADSGANWEEVTSGVEHTFTNTGTSLYWKAVLTTNDETKTPVVTQIVVDYTYATTPVTSAQESFTDDFVTPSFQSGTEGWGGNETFGDGSGLRLTSTTDYWTWPLRSSGSYTVGGVNLGTVLSLPDSNTYTPAVVLDKQNHPAVLFKVYEGDLDTYNLFFARWNGANWVKADGVAGYDQILATSTYQITEYKLLFDTQNRPYVAFARKEADAIHTNAYFSYFNGTAWTTAQKISGSPSDWGWYLDFAIDANNRPCVVFSGYIDATDYEDIYLTCLNNGTWTYADNTTPGLENVSQVNHASYPESATIIFDNNNRPMVAWTDHTSNQVAFTRWNGATWTYADNTTPGIEYFANATADGNARLAIDGSDHPILVWRNYTVTTGGSCGFKKYYKTTTTNIYLNYWNGTAWKAMNGVDDGPETIHSRTATACNSTLPVNFKMLLDSNFRPNFAFSDCAYDPDTGWKNAFLFSKWNGSMWTEADGATPFDYNNYNVLFNAHPSYFVLDQNNYPNLILSNTSFTAWNGTAWANLINEANTSTNLGDNTVTGFLVDNDDNLFVFNSSNVIATSYQGAPAIVEYNTPGHYNANYTPTGLSTDYTYVVESVTMTSLTTDLHGLAASSLSYQVRCSNTGDWETVALNEQKTLICTNNLFNYKANLSTADPNQTPEIKNITWQITYRAIDNEAAANTLYDHNDVLSSSTTFTIDSAAAVYDATNQRIKFNPTPWRDLVNEAYDPTYLSATETGFMDNPQIITDSNNRLCAVWREGVFNKGDIYYSCWSGAAWVKADGTTGYDNVSNNTGDSDFPRLLLDNNNYPYVVWQDSTDSHASSTANYDIFFKYYDGSTWRGLKNAATHDNLSQNLGPSYYPEFVLDSVNHYPQVIWQDRSEGLWKIYYTKWNGVDWVKTNGDSGYESPTGPVISYHDSFERKPPIHQYGKIKLNSNNQPNILWQGYFNEAGASHTKSQIYFTYYNGSAWAGLENASSTRDNVSNTTSSDWNMQPNPDFAIDSSNRVYAAWIDNYPDVYGDGFYFKYFDGSNWVGLASATSQPDWIFDFMPDLASGSDDYIYHYTQVELDSQSRPHILAMKTTGWSVNRNNCYTYWNGSQWSKIDGVTGGYDSFGTGEQAEFVLKDDFPWVIYKTDRAVKFVKGTASGFESAQGVSHQTVNQASSVYPVIAKAGNGDMYGAWVEGRTTGQGSRLAIKKHSASSTTEQTATIISTAANLTSSGYRYITSATLTASATLNNGTIVYYLSADNGAHWEGPITSEVEHIFTNTGRVLKWKAVLTGDGVNKLPEIDAITVAYNISDYASSGYLISKLVQPAEIGSWDRVVVSQTLNGGTVSYQILDKNGNLVPDSELTGNSAGLTPIDSELNIASINASNTNYSSLYIKATVNSANSVSTPTITSLNAKWIKAKAGNDVVSNGAASFDATSSIGEVYTCAWDFDSSDGVDWNNPDSNSCQVDYDYTPKGGGSYTATLRIKQGTATAYDYDTRVVAVTVGSGGSTPTPPPAETPVPTTISLSLNPSSLFADAISQSALTAEVFDQFNNHVANNTPIAWDIVSGSGSLASASTPTTNGLASNTYTAGAQAGDIVIKACTANLKCNEKTLTLKAIEGPSVLTSLTISPKTLSLKKGQTAQFSAIAKDQYNNTLTGLVLEWLTSNSSLGLINSSGLFQALAKGIVTITAKSAGLSDQAAVTVTDTDEPEIILPVSPTPEPPTVPITPTPTPGTTPTPIPTTPGVGTITTPSTGGSASPSQGGPETGIGVGAEAPSENIPIVQLPSVFEEKIAQLDIVFEKAKEIYQTKILENKTVQKVNQQAALPVIAVVSALNVAASVPAAASTLPLLQYLFQLLKFFFTQPAYLFVRRRKSWGTVYDAITKQPVGLAMVRLYELVPSLTEQGSIKKLVQTKVTGPDGRYFFAVKPKTDYQLEVNSVDYNFPSKYLNQQPSDRLYQNLYYGSVFRSGAEGLINFNLPLDLQEGKTSIAGSTKKVKSSFANLEEFFKAPADEKEKAYHQVKRQANLRKLAQGISYLSPSLALVNLIISPNALTLVFLFVHLILLFIFRFFNPNVLIKSLGRTFNLNTQEPVGQTLVYLFEPQFNKLVQTQIADTRGKYGFLIGDEKYYLVAQKPGYVFPQDKMEIVGQAESMVKKDLGMKRSQQKTS